jgi:uncharacterized protein YjdB
MKRLVFLVAVAFLTGATGGPAQAQSPGPAQVKLPKGDLTKQGKKAGGPSLPRTVPLNLIVHLEGIGDRAGVSGEWLGTKGQSRRLEGFQINFENRHPGLGMRYYAHLEGIGDTPWIPAGEFVGTRGQSRRLEGFALELTGPLASRYSVRYRAHLQGIGDTGWYRDGRFCGTRGQSRRLEALEVVIVRKR